MKRFHLILNGLIFLGVVTSGQAILRVEKQEFILPTDGKVVVDSYRGAIDVVPGDSQTVQVVVKVVAPQDDEAEARQALDYLDLKIEQVAGVVTITARNPHVAGVRFVWEDERGLDIRIEVRVPPQCNLDLQTKNGGITVGNLQGEMRAATEVGTIFFRNIDGSIDAKVSGTGDVVVSRCSGSVDLKTVAGNVRIGTVGGLARLETVNGNIELQTAEGAVQAITADGDIDAGFARVFGESKIRTKFGNITATINPSESFTIQAKASWGKVVSKLSANADSGGNGRNRFSGEYNGGGPLIELDANGGTVRIKPGEPYLSR